MKKRGRNQGWDELVTDNLYKDFTFEKLKKYFKNIVVFYDNDIPSYLIF